MIFTAMSDVKTKLYLIVEIEDLKLFISPSWNRGKS
jgi:hypothetical protein